MTTISSFQKVTSWVSIYFSSCKNKLISIITGIIIACVLLPKKGDSSITDWISSISDVLVAFSAIMGLCIAKQWKREATQSKVIDYCINLTTQLMPKIKLQFVPSLYETVGGRLLSYLKECEYVDVKRIVSFRDTMKPYKNLLNDKRTTFTSLQTDLKNITALSWNVKDNLKLSFEEYIKSLSKIESKELELLTIFSIITSYWNVKFDDDDATKHYDITWKLADNPYVNDALRLCDEIVRLKEDLNSLIEIMKIEDKSIFEVFEPKI
ncbi:hypothetical protein SME10J_31470 [Serratia marcescens]|nr:hypothetical protein SME10J_31470 [Serratia marcescens]